MNHPTIQPVHARPPHADCQDCPELSPITNSTHPTRLCRVMLLCYFQQRLQPLPEYLSSSPLRHASRCLMVRRAPRSLQGLLCTITALASHADRRSFELHPNPCHDQSCRLSSNASPVGPGSRNLRIGNTKLEIWICSDGHGSPGSLLHRQVHP